VRVVIENERVDLEDGALLGQGGEGRVYRLGKRAVKIFHATPREKAAKLEDFPRGLPRGVVAPIHLARDPKTLAVVGYTMDLVVGATDAFRLSSRRFRQGAVRNDEVCALLRRLHTLVGQLHARAVVVGDLNDGNVVFTGTEPWMIDTDSMQFGRHLCTVAHERFLDPRLFGADLTRAPAFDAGSDWYAFAVIAFASLLYVHPYGGQHPTIPTMLRRAEARHSVLRSDVAYPRAASPFAILSDEMLDAFTRVFDGGARGTFPTPVLSPRWTVCACGVEHARATCPACATRVQVPAAVGTAAGMRATRLFATKGRIVAAVVQGGLRYAYVDERGVLRREDGAAIPVPITPTTRVAIAGSSTWIHDGAALTHVARGEIVQRLEAAAFDAGLGGAYYAAGDWLHDAATGARVGQVLAGTTWLEVGDRFGVGFYRAGRITVGFVVRPGRGMLRVELPAIAVTARLVDATATFDGDRVLVGVATEEGGRRTHTLTLVGADGAILARASGAPDTRPLLASVFGKCMAGGAIVSATDEGLVLARPNTVTGDIPETKTFAGARDFVAAGADILAGPQGSVYVVHTGEILQLTI
jgi:hypothetical protein